jgi:transforming growth factor-beta-induced protein
MKRSMILAPAALAVVLAACTSTAASPSPAPVTAAPVTPAPSTEAPATSAPSMPAASPSPELGDIVATADGAGTFTTLLAAAQAAGLVETLQGDGPFTVFAPTDDAFAALPEGTLDSLLADPEGLKQILLYHVVPGAVKADEVVNLTSVDSVEGSPIAIAVKDGNVVLNDAAQVVATDVMASNGVIHVIDQVILPASS